MSKSAEHAQPPTRAPRSLRVRLLWGTLGGLTLALLLTGVALTTLFKDHVVNQFQAALERQLDQLIVELEFGSDGQLTVDDAAMLDPRLQKPYSGLYWQIDELAAGKPITLGLLRSRSLWDQNLALSGAVAANPGALQVSELRGPAQESLLVLQRIVSSADAPGRSFRLTVAGDLRFNLEATHRFGRALALALLLLLGLLALAAWAQVSVGLRPLRDLQQALKAVREGRSAQLAGAFPQEVQPLVDDFNQVLLANASVVERARTQAGNLAHALKTPLAVLENEAEQARAHDAALPVALVKEQLAQVRRHVDWHLLRARAAAAHRLPGRHTEVNAAVAGLLRVMARVFADKPLTTHIEAPEQALLFAGEEQDLQEILGNLLENAFKWATSSVQVRLEAQPGGLCVHIEDDGPGIAASQLQLVRQRGVRLDESTPGSGLGLAIVQDLVLLYGGHLELENLPQGHGLRASVSLPGGHAAA
ncbi:sensor histidine kinase [Uliginosibacterium aquaticum]|uniref:histidine kinase n=1 Tax=Uliginosibacterium aquaticum TaxID=2731212 RepID=A0ABX2IBV4_9RHOO|nr:sensor histidine kinase [Uliginosibacterium aquaticum]NSL53941.1 sensor histidine kinase [Uliginosibacterium aquaticum]